MTASLLTPGLGYALAGATISAAIAAEASVGRGDEEVADKAAATAMLEALSTLEIAGRIVVGAGEAGALRAGETVGAGGAEIDLALDALEGTTLTVKSQAGALSVIAATRRGGLMQTPDVYMEKLAIGAGYETGLVDLDAPAGENALRLARAKGVDVREITVCVLDRPRHDKIIADLRRAGARINLISDGDVAGVINTTLPETGIDMYVGQGGAPEGVLAAAALKCVGGQMQTRLVYRNESEKGHARRIGITDFNRRYQVEDMVQGDVLFAATGVTTGGLLDGVKRNGTKITTHTMMIASVDGVIRRIRSAAPLKR
jgi:fructose-1,6-bisphosphatase II / sedoheptulose-1,7-bisphosphatase